MTDWPQRVRIVEVGLRDGLQNEPAALSVQQRVKAIEQLVDAGIEHIEIGSFVSPKWVPQMADTDQVCAKLTQQAGVRYSALVPNQQGLTAAIDAKISEIAVFTAASEQFTQKNINCSTAQSLARFAEMAEQAQRLSLPVRGYVSTVIGCPYAGPIAPQAVLPIVQALLDLGCYEVSLGDTIGVGSPGTMLALLDCLLAKIKPSQLAVHCHDTYGQALANILIALQAGITVVDSAVGGLGGCPYAPGASGNVATEDVVYLCDGLAIDTGIELQKVAQIGRQLARQFGRRSRSNAGSALIKEC